MAQQHSKQVESYRMAREPGHGTADAAEYAKISLAEAESWDRDWGFEKPAGDTLQ